MYPSLIGHSFGGILLFVAFIMLYFAYPKATVIELTMIVLLFSIAISAHSMGHAYAEVNYNWNPLEGKFIPKIKDSNGCKCYRERKRILNN